MLVPSFLFLVGVVVPWYLPFVSYIHDRKCGLKNEYDFKKKLYSRVGPANNVADNVPKVRAAPAPQHLLAAVLQHKRPGQLLGSADQVDGSHSLRVSKTCHLLVCLFT